MRRRFLEKGERSAVSCPSWEATDVTTRRVCTCYRAGAQVHQHRPLAHVLSRTPKLLSIHVDIKWKAKRSSMPTGTSSEMSVSRGVAPETPRLQSIASTQRSSSSRLPTPKQVSACVLAALIETDQLPPLLRSESATTAPFQDRCPTQVGIWYRGDPRIRFSPSETVEPPGGEEGARGDLFPWRGGGAGLQLDTILIDHKGSTGRGW